MIISQFVLGIGYLAVIMLLNYVLPPVRLTYVSTGLGDISFLKNNATRIIICCVWATTMIAIRNRYPVLALSNTAGMIVGGLFGLYLSYTFFKSDEFKNLKKNNA